MISRSGGKGVERVAADANVLLSAVAGRAALRVFAKSRVEVVSTHSVFEEVSEYLPVMAKTYGLPKELLVTQWRLLSIRAYASDFYRPAMTEARHLIGRRDPDDVDLLALGLTLKVPIWTNDRDFEAAGIERLTTAQLLRALGL